MAVVQFMNALGTWMEESLLEQVHKAPPFSIISYECSDVTTMEELTNFYRWMDSGEPEGCFIGMLLLKKLMLEVSILH